MKMIAKEIINRLLEDIEQRGGFDDAFYGGDDDRLKKVLEKWERMITYEIRAAYRRGEI